VQNLLLKAVDILAEWQDVIGTVGRQTSVYCVTVGVAWSIRYSNDTARHIHAGSSRRGRADPVLYSGKLQALRAVNDNEQESRAVARKPRDVA